MHPCPVARQSQHGFSLIELLVAVVTVLLALTALMQFFSFQLTSVRAEHIRRSAQMTARNTLNLIARQLEHVGRDPNLLLFSAAAPAIEIADTDNIRYRTNLSEAQTDNDTDDDWEDVTFQYDDGVIWVSHQGGGEVVALTDETRQQSYIPANGLTFTYLDGDGDVVLAGGDAAARASIRYINVSISVIGGPDDGNPDDQPQVTISQDVFLRNVS